MNKVFKIDRFNPSPNERFFVDTNVWFWFTYGGSNIIDAKHYQINKYPAFIQKILDCGAELFHSPLIFSELANAIENTELKIFNANNPHAPLKKKEFRKIPKNRQKVIKEIELAWKTIDSMSNSIDLLLDKSFLSASKTKLFSSTLDPYDAFHLATMNCAEISKLITDDRDFTTATVDEIFTANKSILQPN